MGKRRGRGSKRSFGAEVSSKEFCQYFDTNYPDLKVPLGTQSRIRDAYIAVIKDFIYNGGTWEIPENMGTLCIINIKDDLLI